MALLSQIYSLDNPIFAAYVFYTAILLLKMVFMSIMTGLTRFKKKVFITIEDSNLARGSKIKQDDPDVERCRRAHQNDLENIPLFIFAGALYQLTGPNAWIAINLFRISTFGRIMHTFVYAIVVVPQPARIVAFLACFLPTQYMLLQTILYVL